MSWGSPPDDDANTSAKLGSVYSSGVYIIQKDTLHQKSPMFFHICERLTENKKRKTTIKPKISCWKVVNLTQFDKNL